jgi:CRISPR-associated exonuclease Cas4
MSEEGFISSTSIKHYAYCPKIIYFENVLHLNERKTESMEYGKEVHDEAIVATLIPKFKALKVFKEVYLESRELKFVAKVDYIVLTKFNEYIPVEVKWSSHEFGKIKFDHKIQLISISILIEKCYKTIVKRGVFYYTQEKKIYTLPILEEDKARVIKMIEKIWKIIKEEKEPEAEQPIAKCRNCGFKAYCKPYL